jgi:diguanylate cyclase (GGDEF)-like protein/PAS domain S-box-containing protein
MTYAGFELNERLIAARGRVRIAWLMCGAITIGTAQWAVDYLALLAFQLPVPIHYDYLTLLIALTVAVLLPLPGLSVTGQKQKGVVPAIVASVFIGTGIALIAFIVISSMRLPARVEHHWGLGMMCGGFAIIFFLLVLLLVFSVVHRGPPRVAEKLMGALILGSAIEALPYLSMATVRFHSSELPVDLRHTMSRSWLGVVSITGTALLILTGTIIASILEGMLESEQAISKAARGAELQFRTLAEAIPQIVWTAAPDGLTTYINRHWYEMTGTAVEGSLGSGWVEAVHPDDRQACHERWKQSLQSGEAFEIEYRLHDAKKGFRWYLDRAVPLRDGSGKIVKWFGTCTDIDDQMHTQELLQEQIKEHTAALVEANQRLQQESIRDPLTSLYNRRFLEDSLKRETRRAARADHGLGVIMFDLDHFKGFNDTYGHEAGDAVLCATAALLVKSVRAEDIVCRYGGEEFIIILPMANFKTTYARAERIRRGMHDLKVLHFGQSVGRITVSGGVASFPEHGTSSEELVQAADTALYRAKGEGRDRVVGAGALECISSGKK